MPLSTVRALSEAIAANSVLTKLNLHQNKIRDEGGVLLADMLRLNSSLQVVDIHHNEFVWDLGG